MKQKTSDIKLVYLYSTIKMMHGPINIRKNNRFTDENGEEGRIAKLIETQKGACYIFG